MRTFVAFKNNCAHICDVINQSIIKYMQNLEKRPVAPILRAMAVGDIEEYPRSQHQSLRSTVSDIHIMTGKEFTRKKCENGIVVKRIK